MSRDLNVVGNLKRDFPSPANSESRGFVVRFEPTPDGFTWRSVISALLAVGWLYGIAGTIGIVFFKL